jgi:hypothetical protein
MQAERANLSDSAAFAFGMIINTVEVRVIRCRPLRDVACCVHGGPLCLVARGGDTRHSGSAGEHQHMEWLGPNWELRFLPSAVNGPPSFKRECRLSQPEH